MSHIPQLEPPSNHNCLPHSKTTCIPQVNPKSQVSSEMRVRLSDDDVDEKVGPYSYSRWKNFLSSGRCSLLRQHSSTAFYCHKHNMSSWAAFIGQALKNRSYAQPIYVRLNRPYRISPRNSCYHAQHDISCNIHSDAKSHHANSNKRQRTCALYDVGEVEYETAWDWQQRLLKARFRQDLHDVILMLEHTSVYTIGRGGSPDNVKFDVNASKHKLIKVDRGGEATYHGPGQLVAYPILNLNYYKKDLHWYLRQVEEVVILTLQEFDLRGVRIPGLTGVWVDGRKVAAIGTHASKWITMHGFGLNVTTDLCAFSNIIPCGIRDRSVGSIHEWIPDIQMADVKRAARNSFCQIFDLQADLRYEADPLESVADIYNTKQA